MAPSQTPEPEATRSYREILDQEIRQGVDELERPAAGLFTSGLSAGLDIGFSVLLMAVVLTLVDDRLPEPIARLLVASAYSIGFIFVILGRSELFTEHTTLAVLPVLDRRASLARLGRLWGLVYAGNLLGATAFAAMVVWVAPALGVAEPEAFGELASSMLGHRAWVVVASGVLAGWLMGLMSWLVVASRDTISQIFVVSLIATTIGLAHLHHAIVGTAEVLAGAFATGEVTAGEFAHFLLWTTTGNILGGVCFVALIKYGHARLARRTPRG